MTGIFLVIVVVLWLWACISLARALLRRLRPKPWRWLAALSAFVAMLVAPIFDEIVGGFQFRSLCAKNAVYRLRVAKPEGRTTKVVVNPANEIVPGTAITIYHSRFEYSDVQTNEIVVDFDEYVAKGGIFIRALGISQGDAPIAIGRAACSPQSERGEVVSRTMKFVVLN